MRESLIFKLLIFIPLLQSFEGNAQRKKRFGIPSNNTSGISIHSGPSFLLGDLGGSDGNAKEGLGDLDPESTRFALGTGMTFRQNRIIGFRTDLNYVMLSGNDAFSEERYRKKRNLSVRTSVFEFNAMTQFRLPFNQSLNGRTEFNLSTGGGVIFFNPKAQYDGKFVALRPLGTEGQKLDADIKPYSPFSFTIPFVLGIHHAFYNTYSVGLELHIRKTFTDYLDDVSTVYYDNDALRQNSGPIAADLADRNLGGNKVPAGTQRGNRHQYDNYFFIGISYRYLIKNNQLF